MIPLILYLTINVWFNHLPIYTNFMIAVTNAVATVLMSTSLMITAAYAIQMGEPTIDSCLANNC